MSTYIDTKPHWTRPYCEGHSWEEHCARRLAHAHGEGRAQRIEDGQDAATERDLAAWRSFGSSKQVAA